MSLSFGVGARCLYAIFPKTNNHFCAPPLAKAGILDCYKWVKTCENMFKIQNSISNVTNVAVFQSFSGKVQRVSLLTLAHKEMIWWTRNQKIIEAFFFILYVLLTRLSTKISIKTP